MKNIIIKNPYIREFTPLANSSDFIQEINKSGYVNVDVSKCTKTTLSISLSYKQFRKTINQNISGYNLLERTNTNMWSMMSSSSYHFKITKKQGIKELVKYVEHIISKYINDSSSFELRWYATNRFLQIASSELDMFEQRITEEPVR